MSRRLTAGVALAFVLLTLLAPLASADHAYSHRFVIYGRVVDANGAAVQGYTVDFRAEYFTYEGTCSPNQPNTETQAFGPTYTKPVTNEFGEFTVCLHAHSMSRFEPGMGHFRVTTPQGNEVAAESHELNGFSRVLFMNIALAEPASTGGATTLDSTYTVAGRLWRPSGQTQIEGITVFGDTIQREHVNITLTYNDGKTVTTNATTNGYGDFSVRIPVEARPTSGTVRIEAAGRAFEAPVDAKFARTTFDARYEDNDSPGATVGVVLAAVVGAVALAPALRRRQP